MTIQEQLLSAYLPLLDRTAMQERLGDSVWAEALLCELNGPFLLAVSEQYERSSPKVVIVGQENNGWLEFDYQTFLQSHDADHCLAVYRGFDIGQYSPGTFGRYFSNLRQTLLGEITESNRRAVLWTNLFKINHNGKQTIHSPHLKAILAIQQGIVAKEIQILQPDVVIFLTGPRYDDVLRKTFSDVAFRSVDEYPINEVAQVVAAGLPALSFRTYHPAFLNRVHRAKSYCLRSITARVLAEFPLPEPLAA